MVFKYHTHLTQLPNCPPSDCIRRTLRAFRFVFEDLDHERNFLPVLLINPKRKIRGGSSAKCSGYALSLFDNMENARREYLKLKADVPHINSTIGTHIAVGTIDENDGVVSDINWKGHFNLHEFVQTDLKNKFTVVMKVYDNGTD